MLNKSKVDFLSQKSKLPPPLLPWVSCQDSLTDRLRAAAGDARLQLLKQCWEAPNWWDRQALQIESETVLHREIIMYAWDVPCWYARTIIPSTTYQADKDFFNRLKTESLGDLIFNQTKVTRVSLIHYPITKQSIEYYWLDIDMHDNEEVLWLRKSIFTIADSKPFYLIETLLPGLGRYWN